VDFRDEREQSLRLVLHINYLLQALTFFTLVTFIASVIVAYIKKDDARGTYLESHFRWQIATFWWSLLWSVLGFVLSIVFVGYFILLALSIWMLYRIIKGWLRLNDYREAYY